MESSLLSIAILLCLAAILLSFGVRAADRIWIKGVEDSIAELNTKAGALLDTNARLREQLEAEREARADAVAAEGVRRYLDNEIAPIPRIRVVREIDAEVTADAVAAENVRRYLDGTIIGPPNEGTLADRVHTRCTAEFIAGELRATEAAECECYPAGRPSL